MAKKRMISPEIIDSDLFLEMPQSSRLLYYDLNIRADDDGFVGNPRKIMKSIGCSEDDVRVLISKQFILPFDSGVIVIRHWKLHNYIRKDRYTPTIYTNERKQLNLEDNGAYILCHTNGIPDDIPMVDTEQSRIEQNRTEKSSTAVEDVNTIDSIIGERNGNGNESCKDDERYGNREENLFEYVEKSFGRTLSPTEFEIINSWEDDELTRYAIRQAELARAFNVRYIGRILSEYAKDNIKTITEAEERDKRFKERKNKSRSENQYKTKEAKWNDHCDELASANGEDV